MLLFFVKILKKIILILFYIIMDFFGKLNAKNTFGMFEQGKGNNIVNIICGVLLIILIIVLIVCLVRKNDNFSNQKENDKNNNEEIYMYHVVNNRCPFSRKMSELLAQNNNMLDGTRVKDITMDHPLAKGVTGTPTILCTKTGKKSVGFKALDKVLEDLKSDDNDSNNNSSGKDILLIGYMGCPFCRKAKELMEQLGLDYDYVESNSDRGKQHMLRTKSNGVPLIVHSNGHISGFNEQEIRNLKN